MKINEKLDSGPVCNKYSIDILDQDNAEILSEKLSYLSTEKILENMQKVLDGEAIFKEQDHAKATYAKKIQKKGKSIQENIEIVLSKLLKEKIKIHGSGRTDTGVHAKEQSAHFDTTNNIIQKDKLINSLNFFFK